MARMALHLGQSVSWFSESRGVVMREQGEVAFCIVVVLSLWGGGGHLTCMQHMSCTKFTKNISA